MNVNPTLLYFAATVCAVGAPVFTLIASRTEAAARRAKEDERHGESTERLKAQHEESISRITASHRDDMDRVARSLLARLSEGVSQSEVIDTLKRELAQRGMHVPAFSEDDTAAEAPDEGIRMLVARHLDEHTRNVQENQRAQLVGAEEEKLLQDLALKLEPSMRAIISRYVEIVDRVFLQAKEDGLLEALERTKLGELPERVQLTSLQASKNSVGQRHPVMSYTTYGKEFTLNVNVGRLASPESLGGQAVGYKHPAVTLTHKVIEKNRPLVTVMVKPESEVGFELQVDEQFLTPAAREESEKLENDPQKTELAIADAVLIHLRDLRFRQRPRR